MRKIPYIILLTLCLIVRADLTSGLLAYYPFDGNADDVSGNGRAGTVHGATWISNGVHGGACHFASISEYISAPDAGLPSGDAPRTISLWLMLESSYTDSLTGMLIYGTNQSNKRIELGIDWRLGRNRYYFSPGGTAMLTDAVAAGPGTWAHLVYTYGGAGEHHLYVNGQISDGLSELGGAINTVLTGQLVLGGQSGFVGPDGGYLDEVRIYNRELSAQEIVDLYTVDSFGVSIGIFPAVEIVWNTQTGMSYQAQWSDNLLTNVWNNLGGLMAGNGSPYSLFDSTRQGAQRSYRVIRLTTNLTTGLLAYYPFDGNANDASGNDRAGTVHGATWISNGVHGGACRFASNSEYISAPDSGLPNGDAPRSISLWLMLESSYTNSLTGMLIYGTNQSSKRIELGIDWRLGRNRYYFSPGGTAMLTDAVAAGPGTWAHLVYTYGGAGEHHLYVNGQISDGLSELGGAINTVLTGQLVLGGQTGFVGPDGGYLDDVRIYNRELAYDEVLSLYYLAGE